MKTKECSCRAAGCSIGGRGGAADELLLCARCQSATYCSKECQRADWKNHKPHCHHAPKPIIRPGTEELFYWSDTFRNGETLAECHNKYGTGGWASKRNDRRVELVFLDATKSDKNSWLLWTKSITTNAFMLVRLNEEDPDLYKSRDLL
jgi:hypothetical protein